MKIIRIIKEYLYFLKQWYQAIFLYPCHTIEVADSQDYDTYWLGKRGTSVGVMSEWQRIRADIVLSHLPKGEPISLGDIACGEGSILKYIMERRSVYQAVGYDSSEFVLEKARTIGIDGRTINLNEHKDLNKIEPADYMLLLEILEHIPESERVLHAAFMQSKKGIFFSFPNTGFFTYRLRLLFGKFPRQWVTFPNEHLRFWTTQDLRWWLKAQGYSTYEIHCYKGIPLLNIIWPSLFAAAFVVYLSKEQNAY